MALAAVLSLRGLDGGGVADAARPVSTRLGLGSVLRGVSEDRDEIVLHGLDGRAVRGVLGRVGRDFVEIAAPRGPGRVDVVPFAAIAAVRRG